MTTLPAHNTPVLRSTEVLLSMTFTKTSAFTYAPAVELAKFAQHHSEQQIGNSLVHYVEFGRTAEDAARALCMIGYTGRWKSTQIYAGRQLVQNRFHVTTLLHCYLAALACSDSRAHCCYTYGGFVIPCRQVKTWFQYDCRHPASADAQFEATAIRRGVNWCPLLVSGDLKRLEP